MDSGVAPIQNRNLEKGRAGYDRNHRFVGVINWELPIGKGRRVGGDSDPIGIARH